MGLNIITALLNIHYPAMFHWNKVQKRWIMRWIVRAKVCRYTQQSLFIIFTLQNDLSEINTWLLLDYTAQICCPSSFYKAKQHLSARIYSKWHLKYCYWRVSMSAVQWHTHTDDLCHSCYYIVCNWAPVSLYKIALTNMPRPNLYWLLAISLFNLAGISSCFILF